VITTKTFPISYAGYVGNFHSSLGLQTLNSTDLDGNDSTLFAITPNQAITTENKIDFIATSSGIQVDGHEVLNSEATQSGGLEKFGDELPFSSSRSASDHKLIFADLRI